MLSINTASFFLAQDGPIMIAVAQMPRPSRSEDELFNLGLFKVAGSYDPNALFKRIRFATGAGGACLLF